MYLILSTLNDIQKNILINICAMLTKITGEQQKSIEQWQYKEINQNNQKYFI